MTGLVLFCEPKLGQGDVLGCLENSPCFEIYVSRMPVGRPIDQEMLFQIEIGWESM